MKIGDVIKPSFALDSSGIEKENHYAIVEIEGNYIYIKTGFNIRLPVHKSKIVTLEEFEHDVAQNYRSKTWAHIIR